MPPLVHPIYAHLADRRVVLALTSPRRLAILSLLGFLFDVVAPLFEENLDKALYTPQEYVAATALHKAVEVWGELQALENPPYLLLAADTVVVCQGRVYEKPRERALHVASLRHFRDCGEPNQVMTAVVGMRRDPELPQGYVMEQIVEVSTQFMAPDTTDEFIERYVDTGEASGVAGGFQLTGLGALMIEEIRGDYRNIMGLPFRATFKMLERLTGEEM